MYGALTGIAPIRPLQLCADMGYQLRLGVLAVPQIMVPDSYLPLTINLSTTQPVDEKEATEKSSEGMKRLNRKRYRRPNMKYVEPQ